MKKNGLRLWIFSLLAVVSFGSISDAQSQDVFREIDQVKRDVSELRNELNDLKNQFYGLRQAILRSEASQDQHASGRAQPKEEATDKQEISVEELTDSICQAVGKFFGEVDVALGMSDSLAADERMRKAFHKLNSTLQDYSRLHRVSKLLDIYQGLAWDTYVAVVLTGSPWGNEEYIKTLNNHKQKYKETCPRRQNIGFSKR
jgi:hypothetical protein